MGCGASAAADGPLKPSSTTSEVATANPKGRRGGVEPQLDAMEDTAYLVAEPDVEAWLQRLGLSQYWPLFEESGYDDLDTVADMTEDELINHVKVGKRGHVKKLLTNIAKLKECSLTATLSPGSTASPVTPGTQPIRRRKNSVEAEIEALEQASGSLGSLGRLTGSDDDAASPSSAVGAARATSGKKARRASVEMLEEEEDEGEQPEKSMPRARKGSVEQELEALGGAEMAELLEEDEEHEEEGEVERTQGAVRSAAVPHDRPGVADVATGASPESEISFDSLVEVGTLGVGTFSRVKMVQIRGTGETYALKIMKKSVIDARKQKQHIMNEKNIMLEMTGHPFLLQLKATFKDEVYLYMLLELCQGGELFLQLLKHSRLSEESTRFYTGNIVLALEALHAKHNIYRDLKPENILLDTVGYVKIGDFGFAKNVTGRTFTRCGTPEYVSPEMLGKAGHDKATDYWSLGIFVYECLHGCVGARLAFSLALELIHACGNPNRTTPITAKNYLSTYKKIAKYSKDEKLKWHPEISTEVRELIQGMLKPKPTQRLGNTAGGIDELKGMAWFESQDWTKLLAKQVRATALIPFPYSACLTGNIVPCRCLRRSPRRSKAPPICNIFTQRVRPRDSAAFVLGVLTPHAG